MSDYDWSRGCGCNHPDCKAVHNRVATFPLDQLTELINDAEGHVDTGRFNDGKIHSRIPINQLAVTWTSKERAA